MARKRPKGYKTYLMTFKKGGVQRTLSVWAKSVKEVTALYKKGKKTAYRGWTLVGIKQRKDPKKRRVRRPTGLFPSLRL